MWHVDKDYIYQNIYSPAVIHYTHICFNVNYTIFLSTDKYAS